MKYITAFITIPLTLFALSFALSNQDTAIIALWPLDQVWTMPLYAAALGLMAVGFIAGALFVWMHAQRMRWRGWRHARANKKLLRENDTLRQGQDSARAAVPPDAASPSSPLRPTVADTPLLGTHTPPR